MVQHSTDNLTSNNTGTVATVKPDEVNISVCPYLVQQRLLLPHVRWYQRETFVFLTVEVMDCQNPEISVLEDKLYFKGVGGSEMQTYELDIELLKAISTKNSRYAVRPRVVEFRLVKEESVWWERLLKDKVRQHWLRVDFQNWKDEEDVGDEKEPFEEQDYRPMTTDWSKHIAANIAKGSSLCPIGQAVMGGAMDNKGAPLEPKVLKDGRVIPPTPAQQAANMTNLNIYNFDTNLPDSDDEPISDIE